MRLSFTYDHNNGIAEMQKRDLYDWVTDIFEAPSIKIGTGCTQDIRHHVSREFVADGWAEEVRIDQELNLTVFALKGDIAFQLQTGNMSRAPYDLLKLQHLHQSKKIQAAILALASKRAASMIGSNIANAERVIKELAVFDRVITVPILLIAFE